MQHSDDPSTLKLKPKPPENSLMAVNFSLIAGETNIVTTEGQRPRRKIFFLEGLERTALRNSAGSLVPNSTDVGQNGSVGQVDSRDFRSVEASCQEAQLRF